jgi:uncharacterized membrane protein YgcG
MRKRVVCLMVAASVLGLTVTTAANATYRCTTVDGAKVCGSELGFPAGGDGSKRETPDGDRGSSGGGGASAGNGAGNDACGDGDN